MTLTAVSDLHRVADALDYFPALTMQQRAHIFEAIETGDRRVWTAVKHIDLSGGALLVPFTLSEAVRWQAWPTAGQILAGLNYAAGYLG